MGVRQRDLAAEGQLPRPTYIERIDRATLHRAMRHEVVGRFPEYDTLTDDEIGAVFAAIPAYDAGDKDALTRSLDHQRACVAYLASMERALTAEQRRLEKLCEQ